MTHVRATTYTQVTHTHTHLTPVIFPTGNLCWPFARFTCSTGGHTDEEPYITDPTHLSDQLMTNGFDLKPDVFF